MIRVLSTVLTLSFSQSVFASGICDWNGEKVKQGQSVWVEDEYLVNQNMGRDWQGYRLRCVPSFVYENGQLLKTNSVMVLTEISQDFYMHVEQAKVDDKGTQQ